VRGKPFCRAPRDLYDETPAVPIELKCEQINGRRANSAEVWEGPLEARPTKSRNDGAFQFGIHFLAEIFHCDAHRSGKPRSQSVGS
jgi:hypothetical protein